MMSRTANDQIVRSGSLPRVEFEVIVVFTNARATLTALKTAGSLANGLGAHIRILVPHIVPHRVPLQGRLGRTALAEHRFRTIAGDTKVETRLDTRLCRDRWQMLQHALAPRSVVVLGGCHGWASAESRLAVKLRAAGHHVVFVPGEEQ